MRVHLALLLVMLGGCAVPSPDRTPRQAAELVGRVAGMPQHCVPIDRATNLRISDGDRHTLVYGSGRTVWGNHLGPDCGFGTNDILVLEPTGAQHCRGDLVHSVDRFSGIRGPTCVLGDFVPYVRP